jgi:hypothetical protein
MGDCGCREEINFRKQEIERPAQKEGRGLPGFGCKVGARLGTAVDQWASSQSDKPTRPEAIRRLVELGLTVKPKSVPTERQRAALADLASKAIDSLTSGEPDSDEKASRKRRLIKGPEEFREVRVDRPKSKGK